MAVRRGDRVFGFGVSLAIEREQGLLTLKQALPQPPGAYLLARAAMAMLFVGIIALMLTSMAVFVGHVPLTFSQGIQLFAIDVLGALPFCAIGMFLGSMVSGAASPAIVNLIFLPMAFLSGLVPDPVFAEVLVDIAPTWPAYHLSQLFFAPIGRTQLRSTATRAGPLCRRVLLLRGAAHAWQRLPVVRRAPATNAGDDHRRRGDSYGVTVFGRVRWQAGCNGRCTPCNERSCRCHRHAPF
jgi:hypothetical protein